MNDKKFLKNQQPQRPQRHNPAGKPSPKRWKRILLYSFLGVTLLGLIVGFGAAGFIYFKYSKGLPDVRQLRDYQPSTISRVYSENDELIAEFYIEKRVLAPLEDIPLHLKQATLAIEDSNFYYHFGIDPKAIVRAMITNFQAGHVVEGGSTITQQLSKTLFLSFERSLERKIREAILAIRMELVFTKEDILEMYLNQIYYGHGSYGVEAAARTYFGKPVKDLSIAECALISGLPKAPNHYSPYKDLEKSIGRRNHAIRRMAHLGFITEQEKEQALAEEVKLGQVMDPINKAPYFVEYIRQFIQEKYGSSKLYRDGLKIYTTLNYANQVSAQKAVREGLREADKRFGYRGPLQRVSDFSDREALDTLLAKLNAESETTVEASEEQPVVEGNIVHGLVTRVTQDEAKVYLGGMQGTIPLENMDWAREPNTRLDIRWSKIQNARHALAVGDVIMVKLGQKQNTTQWNLSLEQEPEVQAGLISLDPTTGHIKAMVGGYDFKKSQFNRATQAIRQPGSAFKPIIFAAAIEDGYTPASIVIDSPIIFKEKEDTFDKWKPVNFSEKFYGPTSLRTALTHSRNVVTIKLLQHTGVPKAVEVSQRLGIQSPMANNLSIALGSSGVTLYELVRAYAVFANQGQRIEPIPIRMILDRDGEMIYTPNIEKKQVISSGLAAIITDLMRSVVDHGTGRKVKVLNRPIAAKTGTTNNYIDAWFMGYSPELVTGVWVGKDRDETMGVNETGSRAAIPIWLQFMEEALQGRAVKDFPVSDEVVYMKVNPETGYAANYDNPKAQLEMFLRDNLPMKAGELEAILGKDNF
ncbi:penicillin-binding protein 1A [Nitrospina watsonii]|uniref:Penicillin-binding protein 1A n=1 Tax=Nitrospina watsonii TaxID=1323948 RepID=A0ABM9HD50_9BACT|nr:PBP1A family penicillin-binding protein [Nitrospina watsonii]CAI2718100.1 Multimodular transpeptidase-transglycosylase [Nitrospina watsonii]